MMIINYKSSRQCLIILCLIDIIRFVSSQSCLEFEFMCPNGKCVANRNHCLDDDDDNYFVPCTKTEFMCTDKMCIPRNLVCDGVEHCMDNSDETIGCQMIKQDCKGFVCKNNNCLSNLHWVCDGKNDCGDNSDEENCVPNCTIEYKKHFCNDNKTCIDLTSFCNNKKECPSGEDEGPFCQSNGCKTLDCKNCVETADGPICLCADGFVYDKTTKDCVDINECDRFGVCSQKCTNTPGSHVCSCVDKFRLNNDNRTCSLYAHEALMLFTTETEIGGFYLQSNHSYTIAKNLSQVIGVSYDGHNIYWTDISYEKESIEKSDEGGSNREVLLTAGLQTPEDIALDWVTGNIYITDAGYQHIAVCSNKGQYCKVLIIVDINQPRGITVYPQKGRLFWTDWGKTPMIGSASMDGSNIQPLVKNNIYKPNGLALDWPNDRLYWVDAKLKSIESIRLDGTQRVKILSKVLKNPFGIAILEDTIYWSDRRTKNVEYCNKFTGKNRGVLLKNRDIFDLHIYHSAILPMFNNSCIMHRCSHLCLLNDIGNYTCACPNDMELESNGYNCTQNKVPDLLFIASEKKITAFLHNKFGSQYQRQLSSFNFKINAMAYNSLTGEIFIADNYQMKIFTLNYTSEVYTVLVSNNIGNVTSMSFDPYARNLFWSDSLRQTIEVLSLQTNERSTFFQFEQGDIPLAIGLVPESWKMFVSIYSNGFAHIDYISMSNPETLQHHIEENLDMDEPFSFATDSSLEQVFWNDKKGRKIESTSFVGTERHLFRSNILSYGGPCMPGAIAIVENDLFWTCSKTNWLYWSDKHNRGPTKRIVMTEFNRSDSFNLLVAGPLVTSKHPCSENNGKCSHVCLAQGIQSYTCFCPSGMVLSKNNYDCEVSKGESTTKSTTTTQYTTTTNEPVFTSKKKSQKRTKAPRNFESTTQMSEQYDLMEHSCLNCNETEESLIPESENNENEEESHSVLSAFLVIVLLCGIIWIGLQIYKRQHKVKETLNFIIHFQNPLYNKLDEAHLKLQSTATVLTSSETRNELTVIDDSYATSYKTTSLDRCDDGQSFISASSGYCIPCENDYAENPMRRLI